MCQAHSTFTRFTRYLPFNAEIACPFLASAPCIRPYICPSHPFIASCPMRLFLASRARPLRSSLASVFRARSSRLPHAPASCRSSCPLCPCQFLVSSVRFPPQSCPLCSLSAPPFVRPASCPVRLLSVLCPLYPSTFSFRIPHVACAISQPDFHLISFCLSLRSSTPILPRISSMVLMLHLFSSSISLPVVGLLVEGECSINQVRPLRCAEIET